MLTREIVGTGEYLIARCAARAGWTRTIVVNNRAD